MKTSSMSEEKGLSLYAITEAYQKLDTLLEVTGEGNELMEYLDAIQGQMENKVDNIVRYSKNLELTAGAIDTEIERLQELKKSYVNKAEALRNYISYAMRKHGIEKVETGVARISFRKSSSVEIVDPTVLPEKFLVTKTTQAPDKKAIKEAIENGESVPGARIEEKKNLQIK